MNLRDKIAQGREALRSGVVPVSSPDLFPTPADVAARLVDALELDGIEAPSVLEPSAGTGVLVRAVLDAAPGARVWACEISNSLSSAGEFHCADFLDIPPGYGFSNRFDRVAMNPPFSRGADIRHVRHALRFLKPDGILVAIVADGPRQAEAFDEIAEDVERLPSGTFQGTGVRSRIVRIRASGSLER